MKKLVKLVLALIMLLIVVCLGAFFYIDTIAKAAIEKGSTAALGVQTKLGSAKLKIFDGQLKMSGLDVANPAGFQSKHFLNLKDGDVAVTLGSLTHDVVEVPHLTLADLDVNLEKKAGKSNYQVILDNLKGSETDSSPSSKEGKRFIIKNLDIKNVKVHLDMLGVGGNLSKINVPIDEIKLENVGSDSNKGVLLKDLTGVIIKAIFAAAIDKGGSLIPADIGGELKNGLAQLQGLEKLAHVKDLGKVAGDIAKPVGELGGKTTDALGGLLGGDKGKNKP